MLIVAMAFIITPLFYGPKNIDKKQNKIQVACYREQLAKLQSQHQHKELTEAEYQQQVTELDQALLDAIPLETRASSKKTNYFVALFLCIIIPVIALTLYWHLGASQQFAQWMRSKQQAALIQTEVTKLGSTENIIETLRNKLQQNPNSSRGWYLLGKLYLSQQQFSAAAAAFSRADELKPNDVEIMQPYAESLFFANHEKLTKESRALLDKVIAIQPNNVNAINLVAMGAYRQGDYKTAVNYWEKLLPFFSPQSDEGKDLLNMIAQAQKKIISK